MSTPPPTADGPRAWLARHAVALIGSVLVLLGFVWLLRVGALPVIPPGPAWRELETWTIPAYAILFLLIHLLRCSRWGLLVGEHERPSLWLAIWTGLIGYGALVLLPFRLGEAVRPALMRSRARLPLGASAGVVAAERILDGLVLSCILLVSLLNAERSSPLPDRIGELPIPASIIPSVAWGGVILFGGLSLLMAAVYVLREPLVRGIERHSSRISARLGKFLSGAINSVTLGFRFLSDRERTPRFVVLTSVYWLMNVLSLWLLLWGSGVSDASLAEASVILGVLGLGLVVPNAPGYFGTFQISAYSAMVLFYPLDLVTGAGALFVFLLYVIQMLLTLACAGVALVAQPAARQPMPAG